MRAGKMGDGRCGCCCFFVFHDRYEEGEDGDATDAATEMLAIERGGRQTLGQRAHLLHKAAASAV